MSSGNEEKLYDINKWMEGFKLSKLLNLDEKESYTINRCKVMIFNHNKFKIQGLDERKGSILDRDDLKKKFNNLNYDVQTHKEKPGDELTKEKLFQTIGEGEIAKNTDEAPSHANPLSNLDAEWEENFQISKQQPLDKDTETYPTENFKVLIFNHKEYSKDLLLVQRNGSENDINDLGKQFNELKYDVQTYTDKPDRLTKDKLFSIIKEVLKNQEKFDALILIIMTHGDIQELAAYDQTYKIKDLLDLFKDEMIDKPKLIILNACRIPKTDISTEIFPELKVENCMVVYAAYPGQPGNRSTKGSRLVRSLRIALRQLVQLREKRLVLDIFTDIMRHVSTKSIPGNRQMPMVAFNLEKNFFIGIDNDDIVQ
ncbi:caspase-3-like [Arctopsyche grandis]|uniref:caspase-3-like n=1 Tax=Arctopsyche grandis TaxID=121162 RepID=UPI00406D8ED8